MSQAFPDEVLRKVDHVYSHAYCPDGMSSAMIVTAAYAHVGLSPAVKFVTYDNVDHDAVLAVPGQMWVDIGPPKKRAGEWAGVEGVVVLDHHETTREITESLGVYGGPDDSGASLAFRHVMRPLCKGRDDLEKWARFAYLCMVRDTWKDQDPDWEDAAAVANALSFYSEKALLTSASNLSLELDEVIRFGKVLMKKAAGKAYRLGQTSTIREVRGLKVGFFNCTEKLISEVGHELIEKRGCDVAAGFYLTQEIASVDMNVSLRAKKGGVPVNKIAESFGGGGHQAAAAFRIKGAEDVSLKALIDKVCSAVEAVI